MYNPKKERKRYYPLQRYCIENYLIDEEQICNVAEIFNGIKTANTIKSELDYCNILQDLAEHIIPIFYYYSILSQTGKFSIDKYGRFFDNKTKTFKEDEINKAKSDMKNELINRGFTEKQINKKIKLLEKKFPINISTLKIIVSAKNFTFPYLKELLQFNCSLSIGVQNEAWKTNCAKYVQQRSLESLINKIQLLCKQGGEN